MLSSERRKSVYQCIPIGLIIMDYMANTQNTPTYVSVRSLCIVFTCFWDVAPHKHNWSQRYFTVGMHLIHLLKFGLLFSLCLSRSPSQLFPAVFLSSGPLISVFVLWFWEESRDLMRRFWWAHRSWSCSGATFDAHSKVPNWSNHLDDWSN